MFFATTQNSYRIYLAPHNHKKNEKSMNFLTSRAFWTTVAAVVVASIIKDFIMKHKYNSTTGMMESKFVGFSGIFGK